MNKNSDCVLLEVKKLKAFVEQKNDFAYKSIKIQEDFKSIVEDLLREWKGEGADAFREDSEKVLSNLARLSEMLVLMCDTLSDCCEVYTNVDTAIGAMNRGNKVSSQNG